MRSRLLILALLLSSCGVKLKSDPVRVEPVTVYHRIILETEILYDHYLEKCKEELLTEEETLLKKCADDKLNKFIEEFTTII